MQFNFGSECLCSGCEKRAHFLEFPIHLRDRHVHHLNVCKNNGLNMLTTLCTKFSIAIIMGQTERSIAAMITIFLVAMCMAGVQVSGQVPQGLAVVRNVQTWLSYDDFLISIAKPTYDSRLAMPSGYNMVALAGFTETTTFQGMDNELSPLLIWKRVYEIIMGNKPNIYGASSSQVQKYILDNVFHSNGSRLLLHVDLVKFPVSGSPSINATALGQELVMAVTELQLDGISILFTDFNAVKDNTASDWLETLLRYIRANTQNADILILLIIPPTFVLKMRIFKTPDVNYLVDYFVLKYYGTVQADYINYQSMFQKSTSYPGTSMFELLARSDIFIDICRTLVAKPADQSATWSYMQFINSNDLNTAFGQAYNKVGWFAGFANLNYQTDKGSNFVNAVLSGIRESCARNENCVC